MAFKKKKLLNYLFDKDYQPVTFEELQKEMNITKEKDKQRLKRFIKSLEKEGSLVKSNGGKYLPLKKKGTLKGTIQSHDRGFAFLLPEASDEDDVYIPRGKVKGAMHEDRVLVRLQEKKGKDRKHKKLREGEVLRVLQRRNPRIVGTYYNKGKKGIVIPDDRHISHRVAVEQLDGEKPSSGEKVVVEIDTWPDTSGELPGGRIIEQLGSSEDEGVDITSILKRYGLSVDFPLTVMNELHNMKEDNILRALDEENRLDLRSLTTFTIDGADAKDFDDAVSLEKVSQDMYRLGVHIADVSYYVKEGSSLDKEALRRGTSVYLPDRVVPMLPQKLSNDLCSLNPQKERLAISVFIDIDKEGKLHSYSFHSSVIISDARMTYDEVNKILEGDKELREQYEALVPIFEDMHFLAKVLKEKRVERGTLDFEVPEAEIKLDDRGKPLEINVKKEGLAESIIEEFMICCNEVIAAHFYRNKIPIMYRVHEKPELEKLQLLQEFLRLFNIKLKGDLEEISPKKLQDVIYKVKDTPYEKVVNYVLLRSLPQARYSDSSVGHFGLASRYYTHFTSPIRRYPDLIVHRILRKTLRGKLSAEEKERLEQNIPSMAAQSSERERNAMEAEREALDLKKAEYMEGKEGNEYSATISGVTSFGLFVELENTVEGLIHVTQMTDDYYVFEERRYSLIGERSGKVYRLGDRVNVRLEKVNKAERMVHFSLLEDQVSAY